MKIKTSELIGAQLDWAVSEASDIAVVRRSSGMCCEVVLMDVQANKVWAPSADWSLGGPLIERLGISIVQENGCNVYACSGIEVGNDWHVSGHQFGGTYLVAAMRAIVSAKLGDEVDVPEGLV